MASAADLEGTLTTGSQVIGILRYFLAHGQILPVVRVFLLRLPAMVFIRLGLRGKEADPNKLLVDLACLFEGMSEQELEALGTWIVEHIMWPKRRQTVVAALQREQAEGRQIILCSGAYEPIGRAFAAHLNALTLGTPLEMRNGCATGKLAGPVNDRETKVKRLREVLGDQTLDSAYGNDVNDVPMLEYSSRPVAVHPSGDLKKIAQRKGWRIIPS